MMKINCKHCNCELIDPNPGSACPNCTRNHSDPFGGAVKKAVIEQNQQCAGITGRGNQCRRMSNHGSDYCSAHQPK